MTNEQLQAKVSLAASDNGNAIVLSVFVDYNPFTGCFAVAKGVDEEGRNFSDMYDTNGVFVKSLK